VCDKNAAVCYGFISNTGKAKAVKRQLLLTNCSRYLSVTNLVILYLKNLGLFVIIDLAERRPFAAVFSSLLLGPLALYCSLYLMMEKTQVKILSKYA